MGRREYKIGPFILDDQVITNVIIDSHVDKHQHINDEIILCLIRRISINEVHSTSRKGRYSYYVSFIQYKRKRYRLVWLLEKNRSYIGVLTAFRDDKRR